MNIEHTGLDYTRNQSIKHQQFFKKEENTKASLLFDDLGRCCYAFHALVRKFSDPPSISGPFAFNDVEKEFALTSRRWPLVDFLFSLTRRRDVPAKFLLFFSQLQNDLKNCPFHLLFTQNARIRYRAIKCVFNCKINLKP